MAVEVAVLNRGSLKSSLDRVPPTFDTVGISRSFEYSGPIWMADEGSLYMHESLNVRSQSRSLIPPGWYMGISCV